jgi:PAS domain S-box-containing protein
MPCDAPYLPSNPVFVHAPFGQDASLVARVLSEACINVRVLGDLSVLAGLLDENAGALLIADEALSPRVVRELTPVLDSQPSWSDLPLLIMTSGGDADRASLQRLEVIKPLGNVMLLERPLRRPTLVSAAITALHMRQRQFTIRERMAQLSESERRLRLLVDNVQEYALFQTDLTGRVTSWNPGAERLFGYMEADIAGKPASILLTPEDQNAGIFGRELAAGPGVDTHRASWLVRKDGSRFWAQWETEPVLDESGEYRGAVTVLRDETDRRRAEQERERTAELERRLLEHRIAESDLELGRTKDQLQALAARLLTVQDDERRRIACELHDDLAQRMAVLDLDLNQLETRLEAPIEERASAIADARRHAGLLAEEVRQISYRLYPDTLENLGLGVALKTLVAQFGARWPAAVDYAAHGLPDRIDLPVATALYRIVQEALHNIAKYARGARVAVLLTSTEAGLELTIEDTGPGFDLQAVREKAGLGLVSMAERVRALGGALEIGSGAAGTTIVVRVPDRAATAPVHASPATE